MGNFVAKAEVGKESCRSPYLAKMAEVVECYRGLKGEKWEICMAAVKIVIKVVGEVVVDLAEEVVLVRF